MSASRVAGRGAAARLVLCLTFLWLGSLVAAPYALAHRAHDRGDVALWVATTYLAGAAVCHQRPDRSFHPWGVQMPVCARCLGVYAGAAVGALLVSCLPFGTNDVNRQTRRWRIAIAVAALPTLLLVLLEMANIAQPSPVARAMGAAPFGVVVAGLVVAVTLGRLR